MVGAAGLELAASCMLGHYSAGFTLDTYIHATNQM